MKVKGNMYCKQCDQPVAAQKSTHRARNTGAALFALPTGGVSLMGGKAGQWHCPNCGGKAITNEERIINAWFAKLGKRLTG